MQWKAVMHSRLKLIVPLGMLFCFGCIDVPPVDPLPPTPPQSDGGTQPPEQADFSLSVSPTRVSVFQGKGQTLQLTLAREGGFSGSVSVSAVNPPAGITVLPVTIPAGSTSASLEVSVAESAEPGARVLTLRGTAGALSHEIVSELTVVRLGDLLVGWTSPSDDTVYVNGSLPLQVSVEGGMADYVEVLNGQTVLARLSTAPYQYTWDTTQAAEQTYTLSARAVRGASTFTTGTMKTVVVDRTAPTVASRTPAPGASNVSVKQVVEVSFSEPLKVSTVKDASVLVTEGGKNIAKTLSVSADGRSLTVTPEVPLPVESTVSLTLGTATQPLTDLAGNAVAATSAWTFSVPAWLPMGGAISALAGNTPAENVTMKVGTDGVPVIAWSEFDGADNKIYVHRWNGGAWDALGTALSANFEANTPANNPSLALDGANQISVMWDEGKDQYSRNVYGKRWTGSDWTVLPAMPPSQSMFSYEGLASPSVVRDGKGDLVVGATASHGTTGYRIGVVGLTSGQTEWAVVSPNDSDVGQTAGIEMTVDSSGRVVAAHYGLYVTDSDAYWGVFALRMDTWGNWSRFGAPIPTSSSTGQIAVAVDGASNPLVAWVDSSSSSEDPRLEAAWWQQGAWKRLGHVPGALSTSNSKPSVVVGNDGKPLVAWSGYASPERNIWVSRWDGAAWQLVGVPLSARSGGNTAAFSPVLALDKDGQPLVAWHESDGTVSNVYVYRYNH